MRKLELLEIIKNVPDDAEMLHGQQTEFEVYSDPLQIVISDMNRVYFMKERKLVAVYGSADK
jgi:hypothetical protein